MAASRQLLHATAIAVGGRAALIRGPSGAGKSDLALRCLLQPATAMLPDAAMLVADDQVEVERIGECLHLTAPVTIRGLIEVRGLGIVPVPALDSAELALVVDLVAAETIERLPDEDSTTRICGLYRPWLALAPFEASAVAKLLLALHRVRQRTPGRQP